MRERVLGPDVDEAALAAGRERRDRHRLDEREGVALHEHAVLERARLRLVGIADEVVRRGGLGGHRVPLHAGRERRAAATEQLRVGDGPPYGLGTEPARAGERLEATAGAVVLDRGRVRSVRDPLQQAQPLLAGLWQRRLLLRQLHLTRLRPRHRAQRGGRALAEAEAGARDRALRHLGAGEGAGEVGADVELLGRPLLEREHRVEARHAVRVRGRHVEPPAGVAESALAHPTHTPLRRPERGQEQVAPLPVAARDAAVAGRQAADRGVDRLALGVARLGSEQAEIHQIASTRIAVALNSAVPDFGSTASIVSTFVATSSWKWRFMNARPGRSVVS